MRRALLLAALSLAACGSAPPPDGPYQATGIKITEVDPTSATVWARLTRSGERVPEGAPRPRILYRDPASGEWRENVAGRADTEVRVEYPDGATVETIEGAAPGAPGEVRVLYRAAGEAGWRETGWHEVDPEADFIAHVRLTGLVPATRYEIRVEGRSGAQSPVGSAVSGSFRTAPPPEAPARVLFTVTTGTQYKDRDLPTGFKMYGQMLKLDPDFFVHTGDVVYYDREAKTRDLALWHWQRMYSLPTNVEFHRQVPSYFIKDDHDVWMNDCWPAMQTKFMGEFTYAQGQKIFPEQTAQGERPYRTYRWGNDLQVWFPEGRDFRSPNDMPDGPEKTIWGKEQMEWFQRTFDESDATFRIVVSPTPIVGPDRGAKNDNHSNRGFTHEGDMLRNFLSKRKNAYVMCGDRHWQYVSRDSKTGLIEYSSGPASDEHAGGFSQDQRGPEHLYLNIVGGFLAATVERVDGKPRLVARHYSVDGAVLNEDVREAR